MKCQAVLAQLHSVTHLKTCIMSNTAVTISHLASSATLLLQSHILHHQQHCCYNLASCIISNTAFTISHLASSATLLLQSHILHLIRISVPIRTRTRYGLNSENMQTTTFEISEAYEHIFCSLISCKHTSCTWPRHKACRHSLASHHKGPGAVTGQSRLNL